MTRYAIKLTAVLAFILCLHSANIASDIPDPGRRGPNYLHMDPASDKLLVLCEKRGTIARVDPESGDIETETRVGDWPYALSVHPGGEKIYVTCRRSQEVAELEAGNLEVLRRIPLRGDPTGIAVSADGTRLYVGLHSLNQVAVVDLTTGADVKRLIAGRGPEAVKLSPRKDYVYVTNLLTNTVPPDQSCRIELTVIDDATARVVDRIELYNANIGRQIAFTSDGATAIMAMQRPKNLIPEVQIARGWVVTSGFALYHPDKDCPPTQLLVDLPNQFYADPFAVAVTPDDRKFYLTTAGVDMVMAVDLDKVQQVCREIEDGGIPRPSDHLGLSRRYVTARIPVGANPRSLAVSRDGHWLYVANRLDDDISVIDTKTDRVDRTLVLGQPSPPDRLLTGEKFFHSAARTFQSQFGCVSCHPEGGVDGLQYDLEPDGIGQNILDNRSLRDISETAPFKWTGTNPDIATQCGSRTAKWIVRTRWLTPAEVVILVEYIHSIPPMENPYLADNGRMTPVQRRGKKFFERTTTNRGEEIPIELQCHFCHAGPRFSNYEVSDIGTKAATDTKTLFDAAHLTNLFESPPYLHDGRAATLEEIWTKFNNDDTHGISSDWTKKQLNELIEYIKAMGPPKEVPICSSENP